MWHLPLSAPLPAPLPRLLVWARTPKRTCHRPCRSLLDAARWQWFSRSSMRNGALVHHSECGIISNFGEITSAIDKLTTYRACCKILRRYLTSPTRTSTHTKLIEGRPNTKQTHAHTTQMYCKAWGCNDMTITWVSASATAVSYCKLTQV